MLLHLLEQCEKILWLFDFFSTVSNFPVTKLTIMGLRKQNGLYATENSVCCGKWDDVCIVCSFKLKFHKQNNQLLAVLSPVFDVWMNKSYK